MVRRPVSSRSSSLTTAALMATLRRIASVVGSGSRRRTASARFSKKASRPASRVRGVRGGRRPAGELPLRQRAQGGDVGEDEAGLVEGADGVLGARVVDGDLAADGGVDHGQEARGHQDYGRNSQEEGG